MAHLNSLPGALVTGSSRGIGEAIARRLAALGCGVCVNFVRSSDRADSVVRDIRHAGGTAVAIQADVSDPDQARRLVQDANDALGGLRVVVNNAGLSLHTSLDELSAENWNAALAVNLSAAFYVIQAAAPFLRREPWGRVVNICSLRAMIGSDHGVQYAAAKSGLIGLSKSLARELAPHITVNVVAPGYTRTEMTEATLAKSEAALVATIPAGRVAAPSEIAATVAFLASQEAGYITGATIQANGGLYMG